jgi:hypothetical protein
MASLGPAENKENTEIGSPQLAGPGSLQDAFKRYRTMRVKANTLASRGRPVRDSAFKTALRAKFIETLKRYIGVVRWFVEGKVLQAAGFWKPTAVGNVSSAFRPRIWGVEMDVYPCNANWFQQPSTWLCLARFSTGSCSVNVRCENTPCARGGFGAVRIFSQTRVDCPVFRTTLELVLRLPQSRLFCFFARPFFAFRVCLCVCTQPYSAWHDPSASFYLDCCGLVRQAMDDLQVCTACGVSLHVGSVALFADDIRMNSASALAVGIKLTC